MGEIIGGAAQAAGSLFGAKARKRELAASKAEFEKSKDEYQNFNFENQFKGLENTAEDLTVNQQASNFQAAQNDQALASAQDAIVASGGGGGGATALAAAALGAKQNISADLAGQESQNQALRAQQAAANQNAEAQAATQIQNQRYAQKGETLDLAGDRFGAAKQASADAKSALVSGLGSIAGGVASGGLSSLGNLFGKKEA